MLAQPLQPPSHHPHTHLRGPLDAAHPAQSATATASPAGTEPSQALGLAPSFKLGSAPHQRHLHVDLRDGTAVDAAFPGILEPAGSEGDAAPSTTTAPTATHAPSAAAVDEFIAAVEELNAPLPSAGSDGKAEAEGSPTLRTVLSALLRSHGGALHLRKTPLRTAADFSRFLVALSRGQGWTPHVDRGLMVLRFHLAPHVSTANEGPCWQPIGSHNEYGLSSHHPQYILFFCVAAPGEGNGGETPIASSLELYAELKRESEEYVRALEKKGVAFSIHHPREKVQGSLQGNGLLEENAFGPTAEQLRRRGAAVGDLTEEEKRAIVEENVEALARKGGWTPELRAGAAAAGGGDASAAAPNWQRKGWTTTWLPDDSLLVTQRVPAVRAHPRFSNTPTFFNNVHNRLLYSHSQGAGEPPHVSNVEKTKEGTGLYQYPPYLVSEVGLGGGAAPAEKPAGEQLSPLHPLNDDRLPADWARITNEVTARVQADVQWAAGDVLVLDNLAVQHARRTWTAGRERKLLASLWDA